MKGQFPMPFTPVDHPHGNANRYNRGCHCGPCTDAKRRQQKRANHARHSGIVLDTARIDAAPTRRHIYQLLAADRSITVHHIAEAASVSNQTVYNCYDGAFLEIQSGLSKAILAVTVEAARAHRAFVPVEEWQPLVRQLRAAGYTSTWIGEQVGQHADSFNSVAATEKSAEVAAKLADLHARYALIPATPQNTGLTRTSILRCRTAAAKQGWVAAYHLDDNGELDPRALPEHPWSKLDARAAWTLDLLREVVTTSHSVREVAARLNVTGRTVQRIVTRAGVRQSEPDTQIAVRNALAAYDDHGADPVLLALQLDVIPLPETSPLAQHPGVLAFTAAQASAARAGRRSDTALAA